MAAMSDPSQEAQQFFAQRYGIDSARIASLLSDALAQGGDFAELFFEHRTNGAISLEDQQIKSALRSVEQGVGIRVVKGDSIGYAYTESLDPEAMRLAAGTAARIGDGGERPTAIDTTPVGAGESFYGEDALLSDEPAAAKVALLERADRAARAFDPSIARVDASIADERKVVLVARSDGQIVGDVQPLMRFNVMALSQRDENRQTARTGGGGRLGVEYFDRVTPEDTAREAARQAVLLQDAVDAPAGEVPVVLAAGDSGILLHEAIGHGLEADFNRKGTSNYTDRIGQPVASDLVTVIDDATIEESRGSINVDDEGNPTKRNTLIEGGILRGYLHDEISARHFGAEPTGSGRRQSFKHPIMPRMTNTYMLPGPSTPDEVVASVERGIYCVSFSGGQVNISNGDFVFSTTEAYLIEKGQITAPLRTTNLIGNGPEALSRVSMVANDYALSDGRWTCGKEGQSVPVGVGLPTVLVSAMTVGGTQLG